MSTINKDCEGLEDHNNELNLETYSNINKKYNIRLSGKLLKAFKTPPEYEDFIRRIDIYLTKILKEKQNGEK